MLKRIVFGLILISSLFLFCMPVLASEESSEEKSYNLTFYYTMRNTRKFKVNLNYTTYGDYVLVGVVGTDSSLSYEDKSLNLLWLNTSTGNVFCPVYGNEYPSGVTINELTMYEYEESDKDYTYLCNSGLALLYSGYGSISNLSSLYIPIYGYDTSKYSVDDLSDLILSGAAVCYCGFDYWNDGNRYNYQSIYSSSVVTPQVRNTMIGYDGSDYIIDIKFQLPNLNDNSDYYAELWADIPTGYDNNGKVVYRKVLLKMYKCSDILKMNNVQEWDEVTNSWVPNNYGSYYYIYEHWTSLIPYIDASETVQYNGIIMYLRSSVPVSDTKTMVSDYVYFNMNPGNVYHSGEGWVTDTPDIFNGNHSNFDENNQNNNNPTDNTTDNSSDFDYIGGITDKPSTPSGGGSASSSDWQYDYTGNWTISDFEGWVNNGFGLTGRNGLLTLIGNVFFFLPADFMNYLFWILVAIGIVALINLIT